MTDFNLMQSRVETAENSLADVLFEDDNQAITEMLVNLLAYCDETGIKFDRKLEIAKMQFAIEKEGENS